VINVEGLKAGSLGDKEEKSDNHRLRRARGLDRGKLLVTCPESRRRSELSRALCQVPCSQRT
jgi:hypothetical protein